MYRLSQTFNKNQTMKRILKLAAIFAFVATTVTFNSNKSLAQSSCQTRKPEKVSLQGFSGRAYIHPNKQGTPYRKCYTFSVRKGKVALTINPESNAPANLRFEFYRQGKIIGFVDYTRKQLPSIPLPDGKFEFLSHKKQNITLVVTSYPINQDGTPMIIKAGDNGNRKVMETTFKVGVKTQAQRT